MVPAESLAEKDSGEKLHWSAEVNAADKKVMKGYCWESCKERVMEWERHAAASTIESADLNWTSDNSIGQAVDRSSGE
jgi:hypothetical protein